MDRSYLKKLIKDLLKPQHMANERTYAFKVTDILTLIEMVVVIFKGEPTLVNVNPECAIIADLHGQFFDLLRILAGQMNSRGKPRRNLLFLGDFVDRGRRSLETIFLLFGLKTLYPKTGEKIWERFNTAFDYLPLAAVVGRRMLCMHGGISPHLHSLEDIRSITRPLSSPQRDSLANDLLWSDPKDGIVGFEANAERGVSWCFGKQQLNVTCAELGIDLIVRGHQVVVDGFAIFSKRLITIFSASKYSPDLNNCAAVAIINHTGCISFCKFEPDDRNELPPSAAVLSMLIRVLVESPFKLVIVQEFVDENVWMNVLVNALLVIRTTALSQIILWLNAATAVNRFMAVALPVAYKNKKSRNTIRSVQTSIWIFWGIYTIPQIWPIPFKKIVPFQSEYPNYIIADPMIFSINIYANALSVLISQSITYVSYLLVGIYIFYFEILNSKIIKSSVKKTTFVTFLASIGAIMAVLVMVIQDLVWRIYSEDWLSADTYSVFFNLGKDLNNIILPWAMLIFFPKVREYKTSNGEKQWASPKSLQLYE